MTGPAISTDSDSEHFLRVSIIIAPNEILQGTRFSFEMRILSTKKLEAQQRRREKPKAEISGTPLAPASRIGR